MVPCGYDKEYQILQWGKVSVFDTDQTQAVWELECSSQVNTKESLKKEWNILIDHLIQFYLIKFQYHGLPLHIAWIMWYIV